MARQRPRGMILAALPTVAELLEHPDRAQDLPAEAAQALLVQLVPLHTLLLARALTANGHGACDRLLTVKEAAGKLGQSPDWLYRHAPKLPFTVENGRALRFSEVGIEQWIRRKQRA